MAKKNVVIVGGHGKVAMRLAKYLSAEGHSVSSIIRDSAHSSDLAEVGAKSKVLSLEDDPVEKFTDTFRGSDVVYFSAGAGGKGGPERTKKVDYEGALKVMDAIENLSDAKPRLVLVSAIDVRDTDKIPAHYNDEDKAASEKMRGAIGTYMHWKYETDKNLVKRTAFKWTILRPGGLLDEPGTGKVTLGRTHLSPGIPRDDVAKTLALLVDRDDASGLAIDVIGGNDEIAPALDAFIKKGETDFLG